MDIRISNAELEVYNGRVKLDTKSEILSDNPNNSLIQ